MAVGVRGAITVDWVALTLGIIGSGIAIIALIVMLERDGLSVHDCGELSDPAQDRATVEPCEE